MKRVYIFVSFTEKAMKIFLHVEFESQFKIE